MYYSTNDSKRESMSRLLLLYALINQSQSLSTTNRILIKSNVASNIDSSIGHRKIMQRCALQSTYNNNNQNCLNTKLNFGLFDSRHTRTALCCGSRTETAKGNDQSSGTNNNDDVNDTTQFTMNDGRLDVHHTTHNSNAISPSHPQYMSPIEIVDEEEEMRRKKQKRTLKKKSNRIKVSVAVSSMFAAFLTLILMSGPGQWRYYLAGGICAAISHAITTPVDVIKVCFCFEFELATSSSFRALFAENFYFEFFNFIQTRKQVDESMKDMGFIQAGVEIIKKDKEGGINALLAGLGPTTIGYLFEGSVKFGVYEVSKPIVRSLLVWCATISNMALFDSKLLGFIISGILAGTAASIMLCPMEALRIRLVAESQSAPTGNWVDCGMKMINNEGIMGFFKSLSSMLFKQVPYTVAKNVSFDFITTTAYCTVAGLGRDICGRTKFVIPLLSAMMTSVICSISSQPGDMLLSVMNAQKGKSTTRDYVKSIMKENGIGGFFVGTRERLVHVGMIVTVQLLIYDFVKRLVGISATGL